MRGKQFEVNEFVLKQYQVNKLTRRRPSLKRVTVSMPTHWCCGVQKSWMLSEQLSDKHDGGIYTLHAWPLNLKCECTWAKAAVVGVVGGHTTMVWIRHL